MRRFTALLLLSSLLFLVSCVSKPQEELGLESPSTFYKGKIVHIAELEEGYLVYAYCPLRNPSGELVNLWITDESYVDPLLMEQIQAGEVGGLFEVGVYPLGMDIVTNVYLHQVVNMATIDALPE